MTIGTCPACGSAYAAGSDTCPACGEPLSGVARILAGPAAPRQPRWLDQNRQRAGDLKRDGTSASDQRMAEFNEIDRRRIESERAQSARTAARERKVLLFGGITLGVLALLAAFVVIVSLA